MKTVLVELNIRQLAEAKEVQPATGRDVCKICLHPWGDHASDCWIDEALDRLKRTPGK